MAGQLIVVELTDDQKRSLRSFADTAYGQTWIPSESKKTKDAFNAGFTRGMIEAARRMAQLPTTYGVGKSFSQHLDSLLNSPQAEAAAEEAEAKLTSSDKKGGK